MKGNVEVVKTNANEIDLIDLLKILIRNKKIIVVTWITVVILGIFFGVYIIKNKEIVAERKFSIRKLNYTPEGLPINPVNFFENRAFIESFYEEDFIKKIAIRDLIETDLNRKDFIKNLFKIKQNGEEYSYEISATNKKELERLDLVLLNKVRVYVKKSYTERLNKDFLNSKKQSQLSKKQLKVLENKIVQMVLNSDGKLLARDIREMYPTIFAEKDAIGALYTQAYMEEVLIGNTMRQLENLIVIESTLNDKPDKISLTLIVLIANVLGIFLGIFLVFVKESVKSIDWKDLKSISNK